MVKAIVMDTRDNVATLLANVEADGAVTVTSLSGKTTGDLIAKQHIPFGHKIALVKIGKGEKVLKYGEVIGKTIVPIEQGEHVHVHNLRSMTWSRFK